MNITVRQKPTKKGYSLFLDITHNGQRKKETLGLKLIKGTSPAVKQANKETLSLAEKIRAQRILECGHEENGLVSRTKGKVSVKTYFETYIKNYNKRGDKRTMIAVTTKFMTYLGNLGKPNLLMDQLTPPMVFGFKELLEATQEREGPSSYFARFKKALKAAVREGIILKSPAEDIRIKAGKPTEKDLLTLSEQKKLYYTPISNQDVRNAFFVSLMTGLRWIDVKTLTWKDVKQDRIVKKQMKTSKDVVVMIREDMREFLPDRGKDQELVFKLPTNNGANKLLRTWTKSAGIDKHITWHCLRHTLGTQLSEGGTDHLTISRILGHANTKYVGRYAHASPEYQKTELDKLQSFKK
jgi:integrase/recombinase XerD